MLECFKRRSTGLSLKKRLAQQFARLPPLMAFKHQNKTFIKRKTINRQTPQIQMISVLTLIRFL